MPLLLLIIISIYVQAIISLVVFYLIVHEYFILKNEMVALNFENIFSIININFNIDFNYNSYEKKPDHF